MSCGEQPHFAKFVLPRGARPYAVKSMSFPSPYLSAESYICHRILKKSVGFYRILRKKSVGFRGILWDSDQKKNEILKVKARILLGFCKGF